MLWRHFDIFHYGERQYTTPETTDKEKKTRELYKKERNREDQGSTFLQLFEAFMESAPQLLLQMYILAVKVSSSSSLQSIIKGEDNSTTDAMMNTAMKSTAMEQNESTSIAAAATNSTFKQIPNQCNEDERNLHFKPIQSSTSLKLKNN